MIVQSNLGALSYQKMDRLPANNSIAARSLSEPNTATSADKVTLSEEGKKLAASELAESNRQANIENLDDYATKKNTFKHLRDEIQKSMNLTDEKLASLSPTDRAQVEQEISRRIQERLMDRGTGNVTNEVGSLSQDITRVYSTV